MDGPDQPRVGEERGRERGLAVDPADRPGEAAPRRAGAGVRRRRFSRLTRRMLLLNLAGPVVLAVGLLYLDDYRRGLIDAQVAALLTQGRIVATALSEAARPADDGEAGIDYKLSPDAVRPILFRLIEPTRSHARVFAPDGRLIGDSRVFGPFGGQVVVEPLPPPGPPPGPVAAFANAVYDAVVRGLPSAETLPPWPLREEPRADDFPEVARALGGDTASALYAAPDKHGMVIAVAVPVQRFKQVLGSILLATDGESVERDLRAVRFDILRLALGVLIVTAFASLYLAGTIARPIRRLALAAERVRRGHGLGASRGNGTGKPAIPDMRRRGDEIGELSGALADMTAALWQRLDAIERFAADVSHEIKNPLTSLKSAVETATRVKDPEQREKLMQIIVEDVARIDRLIGDIAGASRLDAELSRGAAERIDVVQLLRAMADVHEATAGAEAPRLVLDLPQGGGLMVSGIEDRLGQVLRNLLANAASFSPPGATIRVSARRVGDAVEIAVEDEGPGIPADKLETIFERFYSERPEGEKFGTHSGLGLSISRQIVDAHGGEIWAENRPSGGARFVVRLPSE